MSKYGVNSSRRIARESLRVDPKPPRGWVTGTSRVPGVGEEVQCHEGLAEVVRLLGRTGDGSRLLELRLTEGEGKPFFAAASNVLVPRRAVRG